MSYRHQGGADNWGEADKLIASDGADDDRFHIVSVVGATSNDVGGNADQGAAYIFNDLNPPAAPAGADCPGNGDCAVTVSGDLAVTATFNPDTDGDGISDAVESAGPHGGEANQDGVPDSEQAEVATFQDINGSWCTLVAAIGTTLARVTVTVNPSAADAPEGADFAYGFFGFTSQGLAPGGSTVATLIMHTRQTSLTSYYRYGPTPDNNAHHWYDFAFAAGTGAIISHPLSQTQVELSFIDGARGDDDLTADGVIVDLGGPAQTTAPGGGGGGGGSCFISVMP